MYSTLTNWTCQFSFKTVQKVWKQIAMTFFYLFPTLNVSISVLRFRKKSLHLLSTLSLPFSAIFVGLSSNIVSELDSAAVFSFFFHSVHLGLFAIFISISICAISGRVYITLFNRHSSSIVLAIYCWWILPPIVSNVVSLMGSRPVFYRVSKLFHWSVFEVISLLPSFGIINSFVSLLYDRIFYFSTKSLKFVAPFIFLFPNRSLSESYNI